MTTDLVTGDDGLARPAWAAADELMRSYYDTEWGMPIRDEQGLFERLTLEAFQSGLSWATILKKRIRMQGFIIGQDYGHRIAEFQQQMGRWVQEGKIKYREQLIDGLDQAPQALIGLLKGENFGKVVIRVAADD